MHVCFRAETQELNIVQIFNLIKLYRGFLCSKPEAINCFLSLRGFRH